MSAVLRLSWTYFTATPLLRGLAGLGIVMVLAGAVSYVLTPPWTLGVGMRQESLLIQAFMVALPWFGFMLLIAATALMPAIVERIVRGRSVWILPGARWRLLASTVIPALLLALLTAGTATAAFYVFKLEVARTEIFYRTALMAFVDFGLIYMAIWLVGKASGVWRLVGLFWALLSITIPARYLAGIPPFSPLEGFGLAIWVVFGGIVLSGGRVRNALGGLQARARSLVGRLSPSLPYAAGHEVDLLLGTTRPWVIALGQVVPVVVSLRFLPIPQMWLVFLIVFSAIAGAIASQAAARSRRLWLRFDWTRAELRRHVERAFWRYNAWFLAVLLLLFLAIAGYYGVDRAVVMHGVALLVLGCAVSTYLGLLITRGLGWFESALCILTMVALTLSAILVVTGELAVALELELLLGALTIVFYVLAHARWAALDWMQCRADAPGRRAG